MDDLDRLEDRIPQVDGAIRFAVWSVIRGVIGHDEPYDLIVYAFGEAAAFAPAGRPSLNDGGIARPHMRISAVREYREAAAGEARDAAIRIQSGETDIDAVLNAAGDVFDLQAVIGFVIDELLLDRGTHKCVTQSEPAGLCDGGGCGGERLAEDVQGKNCRK